MAWSILRNYLRARPTLRLAGPLSLVLCVPTFQCLWPWHMTRIINCQAVCQQHLSIFRLNGGHSWQRVSHATHLPLNPSTITIWISPLCGEAPPPPMTFLLYSQLGIRGRAVFLGCKKKKKKCLSWSEIGVLPPSFQGLPAEEILWSFQFSSGLSSTVHLLYIKSRFYLTSFLFQRSQCRHNAHLPW